MPVESKPSLTEKASRSRYRSLRTVLHRSVHDLTPRSLSARLGTVCRSCRSDVLEAGSSYSGSQRPFDRLLDPPSTIRTQLATLCRVKAFDGLHQTKVSFRNQIEEREP